MRWHLLGEEGFVALSLRSFSSARQVRESPDQSSLACLGIFATSKQKNVKLLICKSQSLALKEAPFCRKAKA